MTANQVIDERTAQEERLLKPAGTEGDANVAEAREPLFATDEADHFRSRWHEIQGDFVDEPQRAVKDADELVGSAMKRLSERFTDERARLEREWSKGQDVSTEDLRQAFRRYRSFFDRLLSI